MLILKALFLLEPTRETTDEKDSSMHAPLQPAQWGWWFQVEAVKGLAWPLEINEGGWEK